MKILSSFMVLTINGGYRVSYTYDEIDENGDPISTNNKGSFYAVNPNLQDNVEAIRSYIRENKLSE